MTVLDLRTAREHGRGLQVYLKDSQVNDSAFPITPGTEVICQTIPQTALVILPVDSQLEYPAELTLREPDERRIDPGVDPTNIPLLTTESGGGTL